jgi:hypothetical protein
VEAATAFFARSGVEQLVFDEIDTPADTAQLQGQVDVDLALLPELAVGVNVSMQRLPTVIRLALRDVLWCKLTGESASYLHFGYDFYIYVGSSLPGSWRWDFPPGIYAEPFRSPYLN